MVQVRSGDEKNRLFYLSVAGQIGVIVLIILVTSVAAEPMQGGLGTAVAVTGAVCLGFAFLLGKALMTDWLAQRALGKSMLTGPTLPEPGTTVAFEGIARVEGSPLVSPFSGHSCCAYSYLVAGRRRAISGGSSTTRRANSLQGFALAPTEIVGESLSLRLRAIPGSEVRLRDAKTGGDWGKMAEERVAQASANSGASEREGFGSLLLAQTGPIEPGSREVYFGNYGKGDDLTVEEEYMPIDEPVCLIGTFETAPSGLSGRTPRLGPNLQVYRGTRQEVLDFLSSELKTWNKTLMILLAIATVAFLPSFLPTAWVSFLPWL
jgi:hypothetical protein